MSDTASKKPYLFLLEPVHISYLSTYEIQNEGELLANLPKDSPKMFAKQHHYRGFWPMPERPRIIMGPGCKIISRDFDLMRGFWIISERCRDVIVSVNNAKFDFIACDCFDRKGKMLDTRWLCDVTCSLDILTRLSVDRTTSPEVTAARGLFLDTRQDLIVRDWEIPLDVHIFNTERLALCVIVDEIFKSTITKAAIKNFRLNKLLAVI